MQPVQAVAALPGPALPFHTSAHALRGIHFMEENTELRETQPMASGFQVVM